MIEVSLTQFIDFTLKSSGSAKAKYVRDTKNSEYSPAIDYWKQLRDAIRKTHEKNLPLKDLFGIVDRVSEKKRSNYLRAINQYYNFAKNKHIEWFDAGESSWNFDDQLIVRSNPELSVYIDGIPYLLKIYYKGKTNKVDVNKVKSSLTLMDVSQRKFVPPDGTVNALLNLSNRRLYESNGVIDNDLLLSLQGEASHFVYLWNNV
ncbi:hypothetical protein [Bacillus smithii]|uniref:hypothetical protein n=1 Tax=Bacillus smithii TaxID=1479 RepID=UPI003D1AB547